ncbi:SHOCT domain-containing protein [Actinopolymorpha sp. B17G11]|uniref:SHOCT domain-containing protein n=1 Tax=unclassified Actinopolymorpha TaxID=2627063 RepID=UPI0032D9670D
MMAQLASFTQFAQAYWGNGHPGWGGGGPGWWLIFPILFWVAVLSGIGYLIYRRSPAQSARGAAERTLAERYASGDITEEELKQRRAVLRGKS